MFKYYSNIPNNKNNWNKFHYSKNKINRNKLFYFLTHILADVYNAFTVLSWKGKAHSTNANAAKQQHSKQNVPAKQTRKFLSVG